MQTGRERERWTKATEIKKGKRVEETERGDRKMRNTVMDETQD